MKSILVHRTKMIFTKIALYRKRKTEDIGQIFSIIDRWAVSPESWVLSSLIVHLMLCSPLMWFLVVIFMLVDIRGKSQNQLYLFQQHLPFNLHRLILNFSITQVGIHICGYHLFHCWWASSHWNNTTTFTVYSWNIARDIFSLFLHVQIVLVLGAKLEVIVAKMALQLKSQNHVIIGVPLVKPNDDLFWFRRPRFVLNLLHLTLFVVLDLHTPKFFN